MFNNFLARLALLMTALVPALATAIEEPAYELVASWDDSGVEIRYYEPKVLATTNMASGENSGFRVLAGYIFGGNAAEQEIEMTAPVQRTMPANNRGEMAFVMPAKFGLEDLPAPNDQRVRFVEEPAYHAAVIRFNGRMTEEKVDEQWQLLSVFLADKGIETLGPPTLNQYNPPWTLPFMRRNEIIIPVTYPIVDDTRTAARQVSSR